MTPFTQVSATSVEKILRNDVLVTSFQASLGKSIANLQLYINWVWWQKVPSCLKYWTIKKNEVVRRHDVFFWHRYLVTFCEFGTFCGKFMLIGRNILLVISIPVTSLCSYAPILFGRCEMFGNFKEIEFWIKLQIKPKNTFNDKFYIIIISDFPQNDPIIKTS